MSVGVQAFNTSTWRGWGEVSRGRWNSVSLRPVWSTKQVPGQPGLLHRNCLKTNKQTNKKQNNKKQNNTKTTEKGRQDLSMCSPGCRGTQRFPASASCVLGLKLVCVTMSHHFLKKDFIHSLTHSLTHMCVESAHRGQKRASEPLELDLQPVLNFLMCVLAIKMVLYKRSECY